ncbi:MULTISPECIES: NmrA/HSCARG family protein [Corallococcus]|uniref:NmrA/HSCARG family protein n=1 Tax=Corallococcus TaxID=83461 RepID=UPI00117EB17A|nr:MULTISPECIES: NmrA/HSCARG family protein [Corallococcus]NBD10123.1 NmrA family NAD(P)-binding protein [Corallococcus silvisoli]TSC28394.1 NmrA/HSCARG family protein [Corallococcus sp. Z5C101001]
MATQDKCVLVLGATGQQGGATARALRGDGWRVRALVRDPSSAKARALEAGGVELVRGDMGERVSLERALEGAYGVFSVQPSSGQPQYGVTDEDEFRFGAGVVDAAKAAGVEHFVYTSMAGLRPGTGVGHFESKWRIEEYVRASGLRATIVRPGAFMELLLEPHMGLAERALRFFLQPEGRMQFIASNDIGVLVARVFADPHAHVGTTLELAGDELTGNQLAEKIGRATHTSISYARFPPEFLARSALLRRLVEVVDEGMLVGDADIPALRRLSPGLLTFDAWLERGGAAEIQARFAV